MANTEIGDGCPAPLAVASCLCPRRCTVAVPSLGMAGCGEAARGQGTAAWPGEEGRSASARRRRPQRPARRRRPRRPARPRRPQRPARRREAPRPARPRKPRRPPRVPLHQAPAGPGLGPPPGATPWPRGAELQPPDEPVAYERTAARRRPPCWRAPRHSRRPAAARRPPPRCRARLKIARSPERSAASRPSCRSRPGTTFPAR